MHINAIVESLYRDRRVNELVNKLQPADLRDDLLHHCIMYVFKIAAKCPGKIEALFERDELFAWFQRALKMELIGENSSFFRTYRRPCAEFNPAKHDGATEHQHNYDDAREMADELYGAGFWDGQVRMMEQQEDRELMAHEPEAKQMALF